MNRPSLRIGLVLVLLPALLALGADLLAPRSPDALGAVGEQLLPPGSAAHPLGTDVLGRDVLSRLLHGARVSLLAGWISVLAATLLGTGLGLLAGLGPLWLDRLLSGLIDVFLAFPRVFLVLLLAATIQPSLWLVTGVLAATGWMGVARLVRAESLALRERPFVDAARGLGLGGWRLARRHVLPHILSLVAVSAALRVGNAILLESFLSYLGLGAQEPLVSWGAMIEHGRAHIVDAWWLTALPGLAIALVVIGHNLLGDAARESLDPRRVGEEDHERYQSARA